MENNKGFIGYNTKYQGKGLDLVNMILITNIEYLSGLSGGCFKSDVAFGKDVMIKDRGSIIERIHNLELKGYIRIQREGLKRRRIYFIIDTPDVGGNRQGDVGHDRQLDVGGNRHPMSVATDTNIEYTIKKKNIEKRNIEILDKKVPEDTRTIPDNTGLISSSSTPESFSNFSPPSEQEALRRMLKEEKEAYLNMSTVNQCEYLTKISNV